MAEIQVSHKPKFFYGYWIMAAAFFSLFILGGYGVYGFSLFVSSIQKDFGWSRGEIMTAFTIGQMMQAFSHPVTGKLVSRFRAGKVIAAGALAVGIGFLLQSRLNSRWAFYAGYAIIGMGLSAIGPVSATYVVSNWFKKRRGTAIGITSAGIGAGGFFLSRVIGGYLIPNAGWRNAYMAMGLFALLLIPVGLLLIKSKPADMGLRPYGAETGEATAEAKAKPAGSEGFTLKMALYTSTFWLMFISYITAGFGREGVVQSQTSYLQDIGFPLATAAGALGSVALGSLFGKFLFGLICDKIKAKYAWIIGIVFMITAILIINNTNQTTPITTMWIYAIIMGLGMGSWLPTMSILVSTNFGLLAYGAIYGLISMAQSLGTAIAPSVAGYMYDSTGTYHRVFIIFAIINAVAIPAILLVRPNKAKETKTS